MIGPTVLSVMDYGAAGDGVNIENRAFESAFNALPADGGTVFVPPGSYRIDAARSIRPRNNTRLEMTGARLIVNPNDQPRYNAILIDGLEDVEVIGGEIIGDRMLHTYTTGSTHEWGHGVKVTAARNIRLTRVTSSLCAGDGFSINGDNLTLIGCSGLQCRRQGLTIGGSAIVTIDGCNFEGTGHIGLNLGTKPMAGIDIEPDPPRSARSVLIKNTLIRNNTGSGITSLVPVTSTGQIDGVTIDNCTIENNVYGPELIGVTNAVIKNCTIRGQNYSGVKIGPRSANIAINGNTFITNSDRGGTLTPKPPVTLVGKPPTDRDILITSTEPGIVVGSNTYS